MTLLPPMLDELRNEIDATMHAHLALRLADTPEAGELVGEIDRVIGAGGKRIRPLFCYWGFRAAAGDHCDEIIRAAMSLELLHTFAIVHDDIMDSSERRRGEITTIAKLGLSTALLVGDLALVLADDALWSSGFAGPELAAAGRVYARMQVTVIAGQFLDTAAGLPPTVENARRVAILKSGSYSVEHPLLIGATLAGADADLLDGLSRFGRMTGEAFQLRDDLLGLFGDETVTGKSSDADIRDGKRNVLFALTLESLDEDGRAWFEARWGGGSGLSVDEVHRLRELVDSCGARARVETLCADIDAQARAVLETLDIPDAAAEALTALADIAVRRDV